MGRLKIPVGVIVFAAIWLVALCVPSVRELNRTFAYHEIFDGRSNFNTPGGREFARRYPNNPTAALWGAEDEWRGYGGDFDVESPIVGGDKTALEKVAARFPVDLQVRALQLRTFAEGLVNMKTVRNKNDATLRAQWIEAAQIAREGARLEPDNVYWPWMEAGFEFAAKRDDAALRAFERAGKCTRYDDYTNATVKARLDFWEGVATPSWEQKVALWASTLFSHLAPMREAALFTTKRASELRKAGKIQSALALEANVLTAAKLARRNADAMVIALVAEDIANTSLEEFTGTARPKENFGVQNFEQHSSELSQKWANLAVENGQEELAARADWMREPSVRALYRIEEEMDSLIGMRAPWGIMAMVAPLALQALGLVIVAGALLWVAGLWLRFEGHAPTRGQVVMCANFSFWLLFVGIVTFVYVNRRSFGFVYNFGNWKSGIIVLAFGIVVCLCWLLPVWFIGLKVSRQWSRYQPANPRPLALWLNRARVTSWLVFGIALVLTYTNGRGLWDGTWFTLSNSALAADIALLVALILEFVRWQRAGWRFKLVARENGIAPKPASVGPKRWVPFGLWLLCGALLAPVAMNVVGGVPFSESLTPLFFAIIAGLGALITSWRLSHDHFKWQLARSSAGVLVVVWSAMFLLLAVSAWPLRAELNRNLDRRIQLGEIVWMREQMAKAK